MFDSNCPAYFAPSERADYEAFLSDPADHGTYFVLEQGGEVVACGGVWQGGNLPEDIGGLSWGMVRGDLHGQGIGTALVTLRLAWIRERWPSVREVQIETSQRTEGYYARQGFRVLGRTPDGFAPGLDEIKMVLKLAPGTGQP